MKPEERAALELELRRLNDEIAYRDEGTRYGTSAPVRIDQLERQNELRRLLAGP